MSVVNLTLIHLAVTGSYSSALISPAMRMASTSFAASGCKAHRFFRSFFAAAPMHQIKIQGSEFRQFQHSAIVVEAEDVYFTFKATRMHKEVRQTDHSFVYITECVFVSCKSDLGGALKLIAHPAGNPKTSQVRVSKCTFSGCVAAKNGGAAYIVAMAGNEERQTVGLNYFEFCCIGQCYVSDVSTFTADRTGAAIYLRTGGENTGGIDSCFYVIQTSLLNCEEEKVNDYVIGGDIVRAHCGHLNITGRGTGNVGAMGSPCLDWFGNEEKDKPKTFEYVHVTGLSCQNCFCLGTASGDHQGVSMYHTDIVNISLMDNLGCIIYRSTQNNFKLGMWNTRIMDIKGTNIVMFRMISGVNGFTPNVRDCYTDNTLLQADGLTYTTEALEPWPISASYFEFCKYTFDITEPMTASNVFTPSDSFAPSDPFTDSDSFAPSNPFTDSDSFTPSSAFTPSKVFSVGRTETPTPSVTLESASPTASHSPQTSQSGNQLGTGVGTTTTTLWWVITGACGFLLLVLICACICCCILCCRRKQRVENENDSSETGISGETDSLTTLPMDEFDMARMNNKDSSLNAIYELDFHISSADDITDSDDYSDSL